MSMPRSPASASGIGRRRRNQQRLVGGEAHHAAPDGLRPRQNEPCQRQPAGGVADLRRQQRLIGKAARERLEKLRFLRLVDIAKRHDARQQHGALRKPVRRAARRGCAPHGASGGRSFPPKARAGRPQRASRARASRQKARRPRRAGRLLRAGCVKTRGRSARHSASIFCSASAIDVGRTHMQPEAVEPQAVEPAGSCARSNRRFSENGPSGVSSKSFGRDDEHARIDERARPRAHRAASARRTRPCGNLHARHSPWPPPSRRRA